MINIFIDQSDKQLEDLATYCVGGESRPWSEAAHALKGGAATLGALQLRELAAQAQDMLTATQAQRTVLLKEINKAYNAVTRALKKEKLL